MNNRIFITCFSLLITSMLCAEKTDDLSIVRQTRKLRQELKNLQNKQHLFIHNETKLIGQLNDNLKKVQSAGKIWSQARKDLNGQKKTNNLAWMHYQTLQNKYDLLYKKYVDKKAYTEYRTTEYNIAQLQKKISQLFGHKISKPKFFKPSKRKSGIKTNKRN